MKKHIILTVLIFIGYFGQSQDTNLFLNKADAFFNSYVSNGRVNYQAIKNAPKSLNEVLEIAKTIRVSKTDANTFQAFWINAYNLSVIKGIVDHYPTKSPLAHKGFFDGVKHDLGGKKITLNDIEHKLLRAQFKDPRFHFVLVCGAIGCPPLINKAYMPKTLNAQLNKQAKLALNGNYFIKVNTKKKRVEGSEILKWYKKDFTMNGSEIDYINTFRDQKIPAKYKLTYFPYNWNVNKQ